MEFFAKQKQFSASWFWDYFRIVLGAFVLAVSYVYFIVPHKIVTGGVFGIATMINHLTKGMDLFPHGFPVGLAGLIMNIPLTYIGVKMLGPRFGLKTICGFIFSTLFIDGIDLLRPEGMAYTPLVEDMLLSTVFGGTICGVGLGLMFKARASSGGSDIVAMILSKYSQMQVGQILIYVDSAIILLSLFAFGEWQIPLYGWISVYITGRVIDQIVQGARIHKAVIIITKNYDDVKKQLLEGMGRGGTRLLGKGMYSNEDKKIIFSIITRRETAILQTHLKNIDPDAFMVIMDASEIYGDGFRQFASED